MNPMVRPLVCLCLLLTGLLVINCQPKSPSEQRAEKMAKALADSLDLSADQQKKVLQIARESAAKMEAIRKESEGQDRKALRPRFQAINAERDSALKAVLTEDQWSTYIYQLEVSREQMRESRRKRSQDND